MKKIFLLLLPIFLFLEGMTQPIGYYNGTEGLSGNTLKEKLNQIIAEHYYDNDRNVWFNNSSDWYYNAKNVFLESDADPNKPGYVIDLYRGLSYDGTIAYGTSAGKLNREHIWAKSHGGFPENSPMYSDYNNLRPSEATINNKKSNLDFAEGGIEYQNSGCYYTSNSWEPRDGVKGDVARTIFYMSTRYEGASGEMDLEVVNSLNTYPQPRHGKLDDLYKWNPIDLPDQFELNRNDVIFKYQGNRNPYIDNPEWVEMIWGSRMPSETLIGSMTQSPLIPTNLDPVEITATVSSHAKDFDVKLLWGTSYNDLGHSVNMDYESGKWIAQIPSQAAGTNIYLRVIVDNETTKSIRYNYTVYGTLPVKKVQGTETHSPYEGQSVSITGIVTGSYNEGYYIQDALDKRSGIYVYDNNRRAVLGSVVQVTGTIADYYGLTEVKNISSYKLLKIRLPMPDALPIAASAASKDYQSMVVEIFNGKCTQLPDENGIWKLTDNTGTIDIHNNESFSFMPTLNQTYNVRGILNYTNETWRIELRQANDVSGYGGIPENVASEIVFNMYPNPADKQLTIRLKENSYSGVGAILIYSMTGDIVFFKEVDYDQLKDNYIIPVDHLSSGTWVLSLQHPKIHSSCTFIKR